MNRNTFDLLPSHIRTGLINNTLDEIFSESSYHPKATLQEVHDRKIGLAWRLISTGLIQINNSTYTAADILRSFQRSCRNNGSGHISTFCPLKYSIKDEIKPEILYFFTKENKTYDLAAQANILDIVKEPPSYVIGEIDYSNYEAKIWVEIEFEKNRKQVLSDLFALNSLRPLSESFKGSAPVILVI